MSAKVITLKTTENNVTETGYPQTLTKAVFDDNGRSLGSVLGYTYKGIANKDTNPGTPDGNIFYIASAPGTYTHFNNIVVAEGEVAILKFDTAWHKEISGAATTEQVSQLGQEMSDDFHLIEQIKNIIENTQGYSYSSYIDFNNSRRYRIKITLGNPLSYTVSLFLSANMSSAGSLSIGTIAAGETTFETEILGSDTYHFVGAMTSSGASITFEIRTFDSYYLLDKTNEQESRLDALQVEENIYLGNYTQSWIDVRTGGIHATTAEVRVYKIENKGYTKINAWLLGRNASSNFFAGIAFYSDNVISSDNYISGVALIQNSGRTQYSANVPDNCKLIAFTTTYPEGQDLPQVDVYISNESFQLDNETKVKGWIINEGFTFDSIVRDSQGNVTSGNIRYPDGIVGAISITRDSDGNVSSYSCVYNQYTYTVSITRDADGNVSSTSITRI